MDISQLKVSEGHAEMHSKVTCIIYLNVKVKVHIQCAHVWFCVLILIYSTLNLYGAYFCSKGD